jgi:oligopeptide transport system substrate-binding protein
VQVVSRAFIFLIAAIVTLLGIGCQSPSSSSANSLKINIGGDPQSLDPRKARDLKSQTLSRMLFEGLVRIDQNEKAALALAQSVDISSDLKKYTFHLKSSLWSNGTQVTAFDFVYAWKKVLSPNFLSDLAFYLYVIKGAKEAKEGKLSLDEVGICALDEKTLVVELENPTPYFLSLLATPVFFPVNQAVDEKNSSWAQKVETYVCNGPFQLIDWRHQDHITVGKNGTYWDSASVKLNRIEFLMVQEETELKMFEKGELDWAGSPLGTLPVDALENLKQKYSLQKKEILGTYFIRANTLKAPFEQPAMRQALSLAVNRRAIVDYILQGNQLPATGLVPLSLNLQKTPYFQDADVQRAKALFSLAQKKHPLPEITLLFSSSERSYLIAQALQQQWLEAFGIQIKLEAVEHKVYFDRLSKQDYQIALGSWTADFADPINFLEIFKYKNGGSNNTHWENPHFTQLLEKASQTTDSLKRLDLLAQSEKILIDEMPMIPIFYYTMLYVHKEALHGAILSSMGQIDFKWASMEDNR